MLRIARTTRVLVLAGEGAAVFDVRRSPVGASCEDVEWTSDIANQTQADGVRRSVAAMGSAGSLCVVLASDAVHTRPMGMRTTVFRSARAEVVRNLDSLLPIDSKDAALGFVDRIDQQNGGHDGGERAGAGYLIAAEAEGIDRARAICERLLGAKPDRMVAPHQAILGAGFQGASALVRESGRFGEPLDTVIEDGRIRDIRADADTERVPDFEIPDRVDEITIERLRRLAIGAAMVDACASSEAEPLGGMWTPAWKRLAPGVIGAAACLLLIAGAWSVRGTRYQNAVDQTLARQEAITDEVREAQAVREELNRLTLDLEAARLVPAANRGSGILSVMEQVRIALPADAYLESVMVGENGVRLRGIASSARDVLGALEAAPMFRSARESERPSPIGDGSGREVFAVEVSYAISDRNGEGGGDDE